MGDDERHKLPWGIDSAKLQPASMETISSEKLRAFTDGRMGAVQKTPHERKREEDEQRRRVC